MLSHLVLELLLCWFLPSRHNVQCGFKVSPSQPSATSVDPSQGRLPQAALGHGPSPLMVGVGRMTVSPWGRNSPRRIRNGWEEGQPQVCDAAGPKGLRISDVLPGEADATDWHHAGRSPLFCSIPWDIEGLE